MPKKFSKNIIVRIYRYLYDSSNIQWRKDSVAILISVEEPRQTTRRYKNKVTQTYACTCLVTFGEQERIIVELWPDLKGKIYSIYEKLLLNQLVIKKRKSSI